jgi:Mg2+ and Co2+ transporter CorA
VAASQLTALNGQISSLQNMQYQQQQAASQSVAQQTAQLQQNMQNQLHLIQLNLGKSSQLATALSTALNPPQPVTSVFGALSNAVGQTASNAETQLGNNPAIMSLFA